MSLDLGVIARNWMLIGFVVVAFMSVKALGIFIVAKVSGSRTREAVTRVALFSQGGEFAFVLYAAAASAGIFDAQTNAVASATVILSMALDAAALHRARPLPSAGGDLARGVDVADGLNGRVLIIGFRSLRAGRGRSRCWPEASASRSSRSMSN